jgi:predicted dehydrogenase
MAMSHEPLRLALAGVSHDHVSILRLLSPNDFRIVGVFDRDPLVLETFCNGAAVPEAGRFTDLDAMLRTTRPDAVAAFGSILDHLSVVEACAPLGIHVMVEKPLAINGEHADRISDLATTHGIHVLTNYETSWYASVARLFGEIDSGEFGVARKVLVRDGHAGPIETGCQPQFLRWLLDPALSGGGALADFGCYGVNLLTCLMKGRLPERVTAVARTFKPTLYQVDDDALIVLDYADLQGVVQASWNWPFSRKDLEVHCTGGYLAAPDAKSLILGKSSYQDGRQMAAPELPRQLAEPFAYFRAVIGGEQHPAPHDLSALPNNVTVVKILEAARRSASSGSCISLGAG